MKTAPTPVELRQLLVSRIADLAEVPADEVDGDMVLASDLGLDSLALLEALTGVERSVGVRLNADDWQEAVTVADLLDAAQRGLRDAAPVHES